MDIAIFHRYLYVVVSIIIISSFFFSLCLWVFYIIFYCFFFPLPFTPPYILFHFHPPLPNTVDHVQGLFFTFFLFCSILPPPQSPQPIAVILLPIYESVSILLVSSVCSLDSTHEWNYMVFAFLWLAYFTCHNIL